MKKKLLIAAMLGSVMLQPSVAPAATEGTDFTVEVNLTSACNVGTISDVVFNYTSMGGAANSTGGNFDVTCTNGLNYTFSLQAAAGSSTAGSGTLNGSLLGLNYVLTAPAGGTGDGSAQAHQITGSMAAGQTGSCASATCQATTQHSLVIEF